MTNQNARTILVILSYLISFLGAPKSFPPDSFSWRYEKQRPGAAQVVVTHIDDRAGAVGAGGFSGLVRSFRRMIIMIDSRLPLIISILFIAALEEQ